MSNPAYLFGAKLANKVQFYERVPQDKQKKKNPVMRAEAAGESDDTPEFKFDNLDKESAAYKFGKSMCQPCDMSKHDRSKYQTGPMRALSAEEAVKPEDGGVTETEKTEHSETNIRNSGQKTSAVKQAKGGVFAQLGDSVARGMRQTMKRPPLPPPPPKLKTTGAPATAGAPGVANQLQNMLNIGQQGFRAATQQAGPLSPRVMNNINTVGTRTADEFAGIVNNLPTNNVNAAMTAAQQSRGRLGEMRATVNGLRRMATGELHVPPPKPPAWSDVGADDWAAMTRGWDRFDALRQNGR
jgi:hypothetical protein